MSPSRSDSRVPEIPTHPFRRAVLRGLAVVLPPLLTIVIFVWVGNTVAVYVLEPLESAARHALVWAHQDAIREEFDEPTTLSKENTVSAEVNGQRTVFKRTTEDGKFVPVQIYNQVAAHPGTDSIPQTALGVIERYVQITYLKRYIVIPVFLWLFVVLLYLLGKFLAAGVGKFFWHTMERGIHRLPLVRNVYSSVKQVTDFMLSDSNIEYTRVVAVEYPRRGIWSLALVTGESLLDIRSSANEPVLSVLVPTSPMPVTGYTVTVRKSETLDLDITIDQAFQFIVSCGVVVPPQQLAASIERARDRDGNAPPAPATKALPASHE